jgi:hypothetical protein
MILSLNNQLKKELSVICFFIIYFRLSYHKEFHATDGRILLRHILNKLWGCGLALSSMWQDPVRDSLKHGNERSHSINVRELVSALVSPLMERNFFCSTIQSCLSYGIILWGGDIERKKKKLNFKGRSFKQLVVSVTICYVYRYLKIVIY